MPAWDIASAGVKLVSLLSMACVIGGGFSLLLAPAMAGAWRQCVLRYVLLAALAGLLSAGLFFLLQVGAVNQVGLRGMWDGQMIAILARSGLGHASGLRLLGHFLALCMAGVLWKRKGSLSLRHPAAALALLLLAASAILLGFSFPLAGHVAALDALARAALVLHVIGVFLWIGALYPLWLLTGTASGEELEAVMRRFGSLAMLFVSVLVLSGILLLVRLLDSPAALVATRYGQSLLLKLLGVGGLLALAGLNRFHLVPRLRQGGARILLSRSIALEMALGLLILIVTAYFTTLVGPAMY